MDYEQQEILNANTHLILQHVVSEFLEYKNKIESIASNIRAMLSRAPAIPESDFADKSIELCNQELYKIDQYLIEKINKL